MAGAPPPIQSRVQVPTIQRQKKSPRTSSSSLLLGAELASMSLAPGTTSSLSRKQQMQLPAGGTYDDLHSALGTLESKIYFHGELSRDETSERLLNSSGTGSMRRDGYFLVRRGRAGLILSVLEHGGIRHYVIIEHTRSSQVCFSIDDGPRFPTVPGLVTYYRTSTEPLPIKLRAHCPNRSVSTPHLMYGEYGVAWMAVGSDDKVTAVVEGHFAQAIYDTVKPRAIYDSVEPEPFDYESVRPEAIYDTVKPQPSKPTPAKSKFVAAARAIMVAKELSWKAKQAEIMESVKPEELEDDRPADPRLAKSNFHSRTIRKSTVIESKVYLVWFNKKLSSMGMARKVNNIFADLQSGVLLIQVLHYLTDVPKPRFKEMPTSSIQMQDNWHAIVKYMGRAKMPVERLDPIALFKLDQRMMLNLFSILLKHEAKAVLKTAE